MDFLNNNLQDNINVYDIVIYGGTSSGVIAAVQASRMGKTVALIESVFMVLGQSAATAASLAIDRNITLQNVPYNVLRARILADGQIIELEPDRD